MFFCGSRKFRQVAAVSPGHWVPHFFLGQVLARQGRFEEAVTEFRVSLAYTRREPVVHLELADALRRLNRLEEAGASYGHVLALDRAPDRRNGRRGAGATLSHLLVSPVRLCATARL